MANAFRKAVGPGFLKCSNKQPVECPFPKVDNHREAIDSGHNVHVIRNAWNYPQSEET